MTLNKRLARVIEFTVLFKQLLNYYVYISVSVKSGTGLTHNPNIIIYSDRQLTTYSTTYTRIV